MKGIVFDIQRYSIHDGPGIRTTVFLKGCPLRCFWCQNPESQSKRLEVFLDKSKCTRCGKCVAVCSSGASTFGAESSVIDRSVCTGCGKCVEACPNRARRLVGKSMTTEEVMREVLRDVKFYNNAGGGVTLSGGEPTAQPAFAVSILKSSKESGLHTAIETCGYTRWSTMEKLLEYTDLVLYDIKHLDLAKHRTGTGKPNNPFILENAKKIASLKPMRVRVPLIPGFNDSSEDIRAIISFVKKELGSVEIDLLPYNYLAEGKYDMLDVPYVRLQAKDEAYVQGLRDIVAGITE